MMKWKTMMTLALALPMWLTAGAVDISQDVTEPEQEISDSVSTQKSKKGLVGRLHQVRQYLDSAAFRKVDPRYIEVPKKPWRIILREKENMVDVDYKSYFEQPGTTETMDWQMRFEPPVAASIGLWVGYRGTGISLSKSLTKNAGRYFSISSTGAKYGFNFRLRRFSTSDVTLSSTDYRDGKVVEEMTIDTATYAPVWIRSVYVNAYYVFNGRRYSQAAAYNQSVIQRRSAGSFLAGATWYQSSFDYSDRMNVIYVLLSNNIGRIKVHQANIGFGYGYNFVPFRGFVINAMAMPTLSVYNRVKVYKYDCNFDLSPKEEKDDYGAFDPETRKWENGKEYKSAFMIKDDDKAYYWDAGEETEHSMFQLNLDLRLGMAYNWKDFFVGVQAQFNNFKYKKDRSKVNIYDAYARFSLGMRL